MKCERCGRREATFYYKSNINGQVREVHLCPQCAQEMGYDGGLMSAVSGRSFFDSDFFGDSLFENFFRPVLNGFGSRLLTEFPAPTVEVAEEPGQPDVSEKAGRNLLSQAESEKLRQECRRNALTTQLENAVAAENYEEAARLRDQLRQLPKE
ncbi:MAG: hypothetical protein GXW99_06080 [Clostridiales bacterium]|nr:hypothetical protein [Clostridiales bacterium]